MTFLRRLFFVLSGRVIRLRPKGKTKGFVLLSYTPLPWIDIRPEILDAHTNRWECMEMARLFLEQGYAVDVIDWENERVPKQRYTIWIDVRPDMETIVDKIDPDCIKVFHATGAYWKFQNEAERARLADIERRRGAALTPRRQQKEGRSAEIADIISLIGNSFTASTYAFTGKEIVRIPISTTHLFPSPVAKDFKKAQLGFIWFGGAGMAHKGLDLVLEAFSRMPDLHLTVYGKEDSDFAMAYRKELFETPNISFKGRVDPGSAEFAATVAASCALIYPSCSEGSSGSVVLCMHAGLIPIVSRESGVDIYDSGIILNECTVETIEEAVRHIASLPIDELKHCSVRAWEIARAEHTRETFSTAFKSFVDKLEKRSTITV